MHRIIADDRRISFRVVTASVRVAVLPLSAAMKAMSVLGLTLIQDSEIGLCEMGSSVGGQHPRHGRGDSSDQRYWLGKRSCPVLGRSFLDLALRDLQHSSEFYSFTASTESASPALDRTVNQHLSRITNRYGPKASANFATTSRLV